MTPVIKSIDLPNRVRLSYAEQGDPSGVPVLFLPGFSDSWRSFEHVLPRLPGSIHAFAISQRGHGDSERPATGYGQRDFADDVAVFMDERKIDSAIVVGHSMSGSVAQRFALDHPERVLGLVLMASFNPPSTNLAVRELWTSWISTITDPIDPRSVLEFQRSNFAQPVSDSMLATAVQESLKIPARVWKSAFGTFIETDLSQDLGKIQAPTLIVLGERDSLASRQEQEALATAIKNSQIVALPGAGHAFHWEDPERFAALLADFVKTFDRTAPRRYQNEQMELR